MPDDTLQHVSDTALWVAYYRAEESERSDALFRDPFARRLSGERGRRIAENMGATARYTRWTLVIRTVLIDRFIESAIRDGVDTVLNLGAGLDSRPYRMDLPVSLRWVEVDHPRIIEHKAGVLAAEKPHCRLERVGLDLTDRAARRDLFERLARESRKALVLTEGVLPYLTPEAVSDLAADLRACRFHYWITEYFAKESYRYINNRDRLKRMQQTPFLFLPDNWLGFFHARGWAPQEIKYIGEETLKLGRQPPAPWYVFLLRPFIPRKHWERFRRMTGYMLLSRA